MGVDTRIILPPDARIQDVANVMGIFAGLKPEREILSQGSMYVKVPGVKVAGLETLPECANIILEGDMVDGENGHHILWHWEFSENVGHLLMPRSTAFWIAIGERLVDFFGGDVDYNDCDSIEVDYHRTSDYKNNPSDGDPWNAHQERIWNCKSITYEDMVSVDHHSAYRMFEN